MPVSALQIVNATNGSTANAVLGGAPTNRTGFTVGHFEHHYDMDGQEIPKFQSSGQWPNYEYVRRMLIHQEGKIIGANASDYNWQRRTLLLASLTDAGVQATHNHATLYVTFTGHPQVYAQCVLTDSSIILVTEEPWSSDYMLQWRNDYGYWRKVSDSSIYKI